MAQIEQDAVFSDPPPPVHPDWQRLAERDAWTRFAAEALADIAACTPTVAGGDEHEEEEWIVGRAERLADRMLDRWRARWGRKEGEGAR